MLKDSLFMATNSSPLRYPGGKFRARKLLYSFVPPNTTRVLSPFFGGGSFELFLTNKNIRVFGFDGFKPLSNFWEHLLADPKKLASTIRSFGRVASPQFKEMQAYLTTNMNTVSSVDDAAKFFIVNRCSFSGATLSGGYSQASMETRFTPSSIMRVENFVDPLLTVRQALFEESLSTKTLREIKPDLLFLDPPYLLEKTKNVLYGVGGDLHKTFDHQKLMNLVAASNIPFLLTYNDSPQIREMYKNYNIVEAQWAYGMNATKKSSEIFITNYTIQ
jgi:DNA adenine methylase